MPARCSAWSCHPSGRRRLSTDMFNASEPQITALAHMEAFIKLRRPRPAFADAEAFQTYWDLIARRCDAAKQAHSTATPASRAALRQQQQERVTAHYQTLAHLGAYGQQYAQRYQPSLAKLRQQLLEKSGNETLVEQTMLHLSAHLHDDVRAGELAEMMQRRGHHAQAIRARLRLRMFSTAVIDRCLQQLAAISVSGSVLDPAALTRKIHKLQRKGLSQQAMRSKLMGHAADGPVVQAALGQALGDHGDDQALRQAIARLSRKPLARRILIQRLVGKGFRFADVVRALTVTESG